MLISIVTPTFNRGKLLQRCYDSLCNQTYKNFEWIIVDDGSTDDTRERVENFINEKKIEIKYFFQKNQGKHIAHNKGVLESNGQLFICLDSDDYLPQDSLIKVKRCWDELDSNVIGIIGKRGNDKGKPLCSEFPPNIKLVKMFDLINKYNFKGDTALFFRTDILKEKLFPKFKNEKFLSETALYFQLDDFGSMYLMNDILYIGEYQNDGLTSKFHQLLKENPIGASFNYYISACMCNNIKNKIKFYILMLVYWNKNCNYYFKIKIYILFILPIAKMYKIFRINKLIR